ncbi:MAG TPA: tripartite tricarboxylate transporter substrate binding protein [Ramlibacter sp.]|nr:tripartite tricarboxylate transporter substrate binding protein [Ramlibacter sp.]
MKLYHDISVPMRPRSLGLPRRIVVGLLAGAFATLAAAQDSYPSRPITLLVGYSAGGSTDSVARPFADVLGRVLKTRVVVENVTGAGGAIAAQKVVTARPDGYTLLLGANGELVATKLANPKQPYDGLKDLTPIGVVNHQGGVLLASRQSGVTTTEQLIQLVRKNPARYSYATSGIGTMFHFAGEILLSRTRTQLTHVPYRGSTTLGNDLAGGVIDFGFMGTAPAKAFIDAGIAVPIAVTSPNRTPMYPQVPALAEHPELKGYNITGWFGLMAPKGTPEPVVAKLRSALKETLKDARLRQTFLDLGGLPVVEDEDLPKLMRDESARYQKYFQSINLEPQK